MKGRLYWIDWAKVFAIYGIVLGHVSDETNSIWVKNLVSFLSFHVPLFFFVSGYLFHIKENNFGGFLKNSTKSLLVPYIFFNLISAPILWRLQAHDVWLSGMYEFFICKGHAWAGPAWFLVALFNIRLWVYWLLKIKSLWLCGIVVVLLSFMPIIFSFKLYFGISSAMVGLSFFFIGYWVKQKDFIRMYLSTKGWVHYFIPCILYIIVRLPYPFDSCMDIGKGWVCSPFSYVITLVNVFFAISICLLLKNCKYAIIRFISGGCIVIMGLHMTFVQILWPFRDKLPEILWVICESPFNSITSCVLSLITYFFIQKYVPLVIGDRK